MPLPGGERREALRSLAPCRLVDAVGGTPGRTRAFLAHDATSLHVLFEVDAEPPFLVGAPRRGEPVYQDECVEVFLCRPGDAGRYVEVVVNPEGAVYTARVVNPDGDRRTWNVERDAAIPGVSVAASGTASPGGWWAIVSVPWSAAGGPPAPGETRDGNLYRIGRGTATRFEALSPTRRDPPDFHVPARFARLEIK